jgi:hypothetical protein
MEGVSEMCQHSSLLFIFCQLKPQIQNFERFVNSQTICTVLKFNGKGCTSNVFVLKDQFQDPH